LRCACAFRELEIELAFELSVSFGVVGVAEKLFESFLFDQLQRGRFLSNSLGSEIVELLSAYRDRTEENKAQKD